MGLKGGRHHFFMYQGARLVIGTQTPFLHHHLYFFGKLFFREDQVVHPVGFQLHRQRQPAFLQLLKICGVVAACERVFAPARRGDTPGKFTAGNLFRPFEHHMLQHMGYAGSPVQLIHTSSLVPDLGDDHRGAVVFLDNQA